MAVRSAPVPFKVCCISSVAEAISAVEAGAKAIGLVAEMPSGPGVLHDDAIIEISKEVARASSDALWRVLLTSRTDADAIIDHVKSTGVNAVQIVDRITREDRERVKRALPGASLIQVVHVEDAAARLKRRKTPPRTPTRSCWIPDRRMRP